MSHHLSGNLVADLSGGGGALLLRDIRGLGPGHSGARLAGHRATLLTGLLDIKQSGYVLETREIRGQYLAARLGVAVPGADLLIPGLALLLLHGPALLLLDSLCHRLLQS